MDTKETQTVYTILDFIFLEAYTMLIADITADHKNAPVSFQWRIDQKRWSWKIQFVVLRDGTGYLETVIEYSQVWEEQFETLKACGLESAVSLTGTLVDHMKKEGAYELQVTEVEVISLAKDFPLGQKEHGVEFLFDNRHLHLRTEKQRAIQRIRDTLIHATYDWMREHRYTKIDSPIFTPTCAEDSTELYAVEHTNGEEMFLSQTGQMYIEAAIAGHRNVYDFWPVFRAERSKTRRHLNELWMMDAETAFCDNEQNMQIQETLVKFLMAEVVRINQTELAILWRDSATIQQRIDTDYPRITHAEAVKQLQKLWSDIQDWEDLWWDDEELLMNQYKTPLFITNFPLAIKAFYMPEDPEHPGTAKCSDLLAPEGYGEVIWWSERLGDYEALKQRIIDYGYELEDYQWYLDIRKYGWVTTSGFWFGLERLVRRVCGIHHIRESIPFPRYHNRITP